ncbi:hypothetical protein SuNHUV7_26080 (plasmid) [Pseudoseohaeicola sp. NH-UV-7]
MFYSDDCFATLSGLCGGLFHFFRHQAQLELEPSLWANKYGPNVLGFCKLQM